MRAKWICHPIKFDFLQLICKASLNFKANLELALSLIGSECVVMECKSLKTWDLYPFWYVSQS